MGRALAIAFILCSFFSSLAQASEYVPLYRGARASAMGGAYTALADDEQAIFLNPAGMAGNKRVSLQYGNAQAEVATDVLGAMGAVTAFSSNISPDAINALMGQNIYGRAQAVPTLRFPNVGIGVLIDRQVGLYTRNQALPSLTLGYEMTNGVQFATGFSFIPQRKRTTSDFRVGASFKMMWRRGGFYEMGPLELLGATEGVTFITNKVGNFMPGYGVDLGAQYIQKLMRNWEVRAGIAWLDVGNTHFGGAARTQVQDFRLGGAVIYDDGIFKGSFQYDLQNLFQGGDFKGKQHLGLEAGFPFVSAYGGINQMYLTYGVGLNVWLVKAHVLTYAQEIGTAVRQIPNRRYLLNATLQLEF